MCGTIREFGFRILVLARTGGEVVDGRRLLKAARKLGILGVQVIPLGGVDTGSDEGERDDSQQFRMRRASAAPLLPEDPDWTCARGLAEPLVWRYKRHFARLY